MQQVPIRLLGIPLAFVFLATSVVWSGETHNRHAAAALVAGMALLAICTVWTWISVLPKEALACAPNPDHEDGY
jgi:hypothetical protein